MYIVPYQFMYIGYLFEYIQMLEIWMFFSFLFPQYLFLSQTTTVHL